MVYVGLMDDDGAIFRVGVFPKEAWHISLQDFKHAMILWQNVEKLCTFQKIYSIGKATTSDKIVRQVKKENNFPPKQYGES